MLDGWKGLGYIKDAQLETLIIGEGVTEISFKSFANSLSNTSAFRTDYGFGKLVRIGLPDTLKVIGEKAFNAKTLTYVHLPDTITSIAENAFNGCSALTELHSNAYNFVIDAFAESAGYTYTYESGEPAPVTLTLMDGGRVIYEAAVSVGENVEALLEANRPEDREGETFRRWCVNADCTAPWKAGGMPAFDLTLYADMTPVYTVRYAGLCGGAELWHAEARVGEGNVIPWPEEPNLVGYRFEGWYCDEDMNRRFTENVVMGGEDTVIYGKMVPGRNGAVYTGSGSSVVFTAAQDGLTLSRYVLLEGDSTEVWLPSLFDGQPVTAIAADAFADAQQITRCTCRIP